MKASLLKPATNQQAFGKVGLLGFQGSGKTTTAMLIAQGICKLVGGKKIAFFDTETGSDWFVRRMPTGVELVVAKSRSFQDVCTVITECEQNSIPVLIIDSITHVWRDLTESYQRKLNRKRLQFQDWAIIKSEWGRYADLYVNSKVHIIVCGRAGYEYDYDVNEDGSKDLVKTGTKMKAEGEFGFEPSLVVEMERVSESHEAADALKSKDKSTFKPKIGAKTTHRAHIIKDRADVIDGKQFDDPTFEAFAPHFAQLNIGGDHVGVDVKRDSQDLFDQSGDNGWRREQKARDVCADEIAELIPKHFPGQSAAEKKAKGDIIEAVFGTRSWEAIKGYQSVDLKVGLAALRRLFDLPRETLDIALRSGIDDDGKTVLDGDAARKALVALLADRTGEDDIPEFGADRGYDEVKALAGRAGPEGLSKACATLGIEVGVVTRDYPHLDAVKAELEKLIAGSTTG